MSEKKESVGEKARKPVSNTVLGFVYLFIAVMIISVGYITHLTNVVGFSIEMPDDILSFAISQIDLYFIEYIVVGFFTGMFSVLGIHFIRKRGEPVAQPS